MATFETFDPNSLINLVQTFTSIITVVTLALFSVTFVYILYFIITLIKKYSEKPAEKKDILEEKFKQLNQIFNRAQELMPEVESEITRKQESVKTLQSKYETYKNIPPLSKENLEALTTVFQGQLDADRPKSIFWNILIGAFFFGLGVLAQKYLLP